MRSLLAFGRPDSMGDLAQEVQPMARRLRSVKPPSAPRQGPPPKLPRGGKKGRDRVGAQSDAGTRSSDIAMLHRVPAQKFGGQSAGEQHLGDCVSEVWRASRPVATTHALDSFWRPRMAAVGRNAKLCIATPMHSTQLCVVAPRPTRPTTRSTTASRRGALSIVTGSAGTSSSRRRHGIAAA